MGGLMRGLLIAGAVALLGMGSAAEAHILSVQVIGSGVMAKAAPDLSQKIACGSRGGPGYRKANGKCASWRR